MSKLKIGLFVASLLLHSTCVMVNVSNWAAEFSQIVLMLTQNCTNGLWGRYLCDKCKITDRDQDWVFAVCHSCCGGGVGCLDCGNPMIQVLCQNEAWQYLRKTHLAGSLEDSILPKEYIVRTFLCDWERLQSKARIFLDFAGFDN